MLLIFYCRKEIKAEAIIFIIYKINLFDKINTGLFSKSRCLYFYGREEIKAETIVFITYKMNLFDYNSKINTYFSSISFV